MKEVFNPNLICPLCGIRQVLHNGKKYTHREHIPPQSLFADSKDNLITVPSCMECNAGSSHLDERFKTVLGLYLGYRAPNFWGSVVATVRRSKAHRDEIRANTSELLIPTKSGEYRHPVKLGQKNGAALKNALIKIARGLYWKVNHEVLPPDAKINISMIRQDDSVHPEIKKILDDYGQWIRSGGATFEVQYATVTETKLASLWFIRFYNEDCFMIAITPPLRLDPRFYNDDKTLK